MRQTKIYTTRRMNAIFINIFVGPVGDNILDRDGGDIVEAAVAVVGKNKAD